MVKKQATTRLFFVSFRNKDRRFTQDVFGSAKPHLQEQVDIINSLQPADGVRKVEYAELIHPNSRKSTMNHEMEAHVQNSANEEEVEAIPQYNTPGEFQAQDRNFSVQNYNVDTHFDEQQQEIPSFDYIENDVEKAIFFEDPIFYTF